MLYILKEVLDEMESFTGAQSGDEAKGSSPTVNADSARMIMDYISLATQDGMHSASPPLLSQCSWILTVRQSIIFSELVGTSLRAHSPRRPGSI